MLVYHVRHSGHDIMLNIQYFWIDGFVDGDTRDMDNVLLLRSPDCKFCFFRGNTYRVCQTELPGEDNDDDRPFVKAWVKDPFADCDLYEQIEDVNFAQGESGVLIGYAGGGGECRTSPSVPEQDDSGGWPI